MQMLMHTFAALVLWSVWLILLIFGAAATYQVLNLIWSLV